MKTGVLVVLCLILGVLSGVWFAKKSGFLQTDQQLPPIYRQLNTYFEQQGLSVDISITKKSYSIPSKASAIVRLKDGSDKLFFVILCHTPTEAKNYFDFLANVPSKILYAVNDNLVIYMPDWANDDPVAQKILNSFAVFKVEAY